LWKDGPIRVVEDGDDALATPDFAVARLAKAVEFAGGIACSIDGLEGLGRGRRDLQASENVMSPLAVLILHNTVEVFWTEARGIDGGAKPERAIGGLKGGAPINSPGHVGMNGHGPVLSVETSGGGRMFMTAGDPNFALAGSNEDGWIIDEAVLGAVTEPLLAIVLDDASITVKEPLGT